MGMVFYLTDGRAQAYRVPDADFKPVKESSPWVEITHDLKLDPGTETVRFIIVDRGSKETGSLTVPITLAKREPQ